MGAEYALVHLWFTIPPALLLGLIYFPLATRIGLYKIAFLITIAVVSTTPWDAYLIRARIWTYPDTAIYGPCLFGIPAEEYFFFVIQTLNTSLLYLILSKPTFHPVYLCGQQKLLHDGKRLRQWRTLGAIFMILTICIGGRLVVQRGQGFYLGLIIIWAGPFLLMLWCLAYQLLLGLPTSNTLLPILMPTAYLWAVDTFALRRGTWVIASGTKLDWQLWDGLDIEEAVFFLVTNTLIVFGLVAFDNAYAILQSFPRLFPTCPALPTPPLLVKGLLASPETYDETRIAGFREALDCLRRKSRSFYLASAFFPGRLRVDLMLLYSFCRIADDLVDEAASSSDAKHWISLLHRFLELSYLRSEKRNEFVISNFPASAHSALLLLPVDKLSSQPLFDLLRGFETDLQFSEKSPTFPIADEEELRQYGARVAGTVAELCLELVYHHTDGANSPETWRQVVQAGGEMGVALQYINIARDINVDATNGRIYLPTAWLSAYKITPQSVLADNHSPNVLLLQQQLLDRAMCIYEQSKDAIEALPGDARAPIRVAVESYVEIGRRLKEPGCRIQTGRATVPRLRRFRVALTALARG